MFLLIQTDKPFGRVATCGHGSASQSCGRTVQFFWRAAFLVLVVLFPGVLFVFRMGDAEEADSLEVLQALAIQKSDGDTIGVRLGYAYLNAGRLDKAREAFQRAAKGNFAAEAYNGLGLVYSQSTKTVKQKAFAYFQSALAIDPDYLEAQMNIARLHLKLGDLDAERALKNVIERHPTYGPAYLILGNWYKDNHFYDRRIALYEKYLRLKPGDPEGLYGLALTYLEQHHYTPVLEILKPALQKSPVSLQLLPLAAQAYAAKGEPERAVHLFKVYFDSLGEKERALYEDLSLVAFPKEIEAYNAIRAEEQEKYRDSFWQRRDVALVSGGKMMEAEHYRRVWYARTFFGTQVFPWDRRGEVYIRYGEPDYRARSNQVNAVPPSLAVQRIRDLNSQKIFGVYDSGSDLEQPKGWVLRPSPPPQEEWVYTKVAGGLQLLFLDEVQNGDFDFPPMPHADSETSIRTFSQLMALHPSVIYQRIIREVPEYQGVPPGVEPLDFHYAFATFHSSVRAREKVEVYFGVPLNQIASETSEGQKISKAKMAVALQDAQGGETYRSFSDLIFPAVDVRTLKKGTLVPDVVSLEVPPGDYRLTVQLVDQVSGKWGVYMQDLSVPDYSDSLAISDLELAWKISNVQGQAKFKKGDIWVIPMPSRSYRKRQNIPLYYEMYNLSRNQYGQTKYRISYSIQRYTHRGSGFFGALSATIRGLIPAGEEKVIVSYEHTGQGSVEPIYFELDGHNIKPGLNLLKVIVTDLNRETRSSKSVIFQMQEAAGD